MVCWGAQKKMKVKISCPQDYDLFGDLKKERNQEDKIQNTQFSTLVYRALLDAMCGTLEHFGRKSHVNLAYEAT